jgi:hypothetical protein
MAGRYKKQTVDYFPHYVNHGKVLFIVESLWGNDGYSAFYRLLEILGDTDGHFYKAETEEQALFLAATMKVSQDTAEAILCKLAKMGVIDEQLWTGARGIWMQSFVDSLAPAYRKRQMALPTRPGIEGDKPGAGNDKGGAGNKGNGEGKPKRAKPEYAEGSEPIALARHLLRNIRELMPDYKEPNIQAWAYEMDLMIRSDNRSATEIHEVLDFVKGDDFWRAVILSAGNLRKKYDQLRMKMNRGKNGQSKKSEYREPGKQYRGPDVEA